MLLRLSPSQSTIVIWQEIKTLIWCSIEAGQILTMFPAYYVFNFLLTTLLILHLFWGYFIIKVAYKVGKNRPKQKTFLISSSGDAGRWHSDGHKESVGKLQWLVMTYLIYIISAVLVPIWVATKKKQINDVWPQRPWIILLRKLWNFLNMDKNCENGLSE